jgi:hypothetical protein
LASESLVVDKQLQPGEIVVFIQKGGVMTAAIDPSSGNPFPIDQFGQEKGWLAVTDSHRAIYGYFSGFGGAKFGGSFGFTGWQDDGRGVALINEGIGPEDLLILVPMTVAPAVLHAAMSKNFGDPM